MQSILLSASIIFLSAFAPSDNFIGSYGVSESDPAQIKLSINADHSFYYQDFSVSEKKIVVEGTWDTKGDKVVLKSKSSDPKFHDVWKFTENGQAAKSRKGLSFYRLSRLPI